MDQQQIIADIEDRAEDLGISIRFLCQRAVIHPSTFWRWKKTPNNPDPVDANFGSFKKLWDALDQIAAEKRRRRANKAKAVAA